MGKITETQRIDKTNRRNSETQQIGGTNRRGRPNSAADLGGGGVVPEFDPKNLPKWAEEFSEFLLVMRQQNADVETKCTLIKKSSKTKFLQRQVKTAIKKSSSWRDRKKKANPTHTITCASHCFSMQQSLHDPAPVFLGLTPGIGLGGNPGKPLGWDLAVTLVTHLEPN